jgi:hypothetical protein
MNLPSGLLAYVADDEVVARHVFTRNHLISDTKDIKKKWARPQAFLPQPTDDGWVFSVSRTLQLKDDETIQQNGVDVGKVSKRGYKGSALIAVRQVREVAMKNGDGEGLHQLDVAAHEALDGSTPYHAHVQGFLPLPQGANMKEYFKEASEDLALRARERAFILRSLPAQDGETTE